MYKRILVPVNGSHTSEAVLPSVKKMAQRMGAEVVLFQAVSPNLKRVEFPDEQTPAVYLDQELERIWLRAEVYLHRMARELKADGISVRTVIGLGDPVNEILRAAEKVDADVIAMSTHGRSGLGRLIHGSVAERVVRSSTRPVVLIRPEIRIRQAA